MRVRSLLALAILAALLPLAPTAAQSDQRCFPETGQCIAGPIRAYWERNGGLPVFGFPINAQAQEIVEGTPLQVQWFERDRLEIQPGGMVTAGRLGVERLEQQGINWQALPGDEAAQPGCHFFTETQFNLCEPFLGYWQANGGLERFGFPVTRQRPEMLEGREYVVQYFERRRFELHPEVGPNAVLLGLLGREVLSGRQGQPPAPQPTPQPAAPSYNNCQADPNAGAAPNYPVRIVGVNDGDETVTLRNVSPDPVSLDGWIMCSVRGNQRHDGIGGVLGAGETRTFGYTGPGTIWSNSDPDPGALYNAQGQLISYWPD